MATNSNRSSGTQHNKRGVTQGVTLVDPITGLPIDVKKDNAGTNRLAVDANITVDSVTVTTDDLNATDDAVRIEDPVTSAHIRVEPDGSINTNCKIDASTDNIAIKDAEGDELDINPDGSINVKEIPGGTNIISAFNEISSVASGISTILQSYSVPLGKTDFLKQVDVSGTNIAQYEIYVNGSIFDRKRTYFGGSLNEVFTLGEYKLVAGDTIVVKVIHNRPDLGDFNSRIQLEEI